MKGKHENLGVTAFFLGEQEVQCNQGASESRRRKRDAPFGSTPIPTKLLNSCVGGNIKQGEKGAGGGRGGG